MDSESLPFANELSQWLTNHADGISLGLYQSDCRLWFQFGPHEFTDRYVIDEQIGQHFHWQEDGVALLGVIKTKESVAIWPKLIQSVLSQLHFKYQKYHCQQQVLKSERLASLGELVPSLTHEVNNPVGIAITAATGLNDEICEVEKALQEGRLSEEFFDRFLAKSKHFGDLLQKNLIRASDLLQHFKQSAIHQKDVQHHGFRLNQVIEDLIASLHPLLKKQSIKVELNMPSLDIMGIPAIWTQILSNLLINSCKHAFDGVDHPSIHLNITQQQETLTLKYQDNGVGIPVEIHDRLFDPFFTTKAQQGGSGIGLSVVKGLIEKELKGELTFQSEVNQGMTLQFKCPIQMAK